MSSRKYKVNESFFETWSIDMAYVLGVIAADGCVSINKGGSKSIRIGVNTKDIKWLNKIKFLLDSEHLIYAREKDNISLLVIGSKRLVDALIRLGIKPHKSSTLCFPEVPAQFVSHFVRGYFDGDGYIGKMSDGKGNHYLRVSISGTSSFLSRLRDIFSDIYGKNIGPIRGANRCAELTYAGTGSVMGFCAWMYDGSVDANRLERKYNYASSWGLSLDEQTSVNSSKGRSSQPRCEADLTGREEVGFDGLLRSHQYAPPQAIGRI